MREDVTYEHLFSLIEPIPKMIATNRSNESSSCSKYNLDSTRHNNTVNTLQWCHNECDGVSNHRRLDGLLNPLFRRRSKKTSKLRITGLCEGNSPVTGEFRSQRASKAEKVSIWWPYHGIFCDIHVESCSPHLLFMVTEWQDAADRRWAFNVHILDQLAWEKSKLIEE